MYVRPPLVPNAQPPELIQPGEGPLHYPPPSAQSAAVFGVALREPRHDATGTQTPPDRLCVITSVAGHALRPVARTTPLSL